MIDRTQPREPQRERKTFRKATSHFMMRSRKKCRKNPLAARPVNLSPHKHFQATELIDDDIRRWPDVLQTVGAGAATDTAGTDWMYSTPGAGVQYAFVTGKCRASADAGVMCSHNCWSKSSEGHCKSKQGELDKRAPVRQYTAAAGQCYASGGDGDVLINECRRNANTHLALARCTRILTHDNLPGMTTSGHCNCSTPTVRMVSLGSLWFCYALELSAAELRSVSKLESRVPKYLLHRER